MVVVPELQDEQGLVAEIQEDVEDQLVITLKAATGIILVTRENATNRTAKNLEEVNLAARTPKEASDLVARTLKAKARIPRGARNPAAMILRERVWTPREAKDPAARTPRKARTPREAKDPVARTLRGATARTQSDGEDPAARTPKGMTGHAERTQEEGGVRGTQGIQEERAKTLGVTTCSAW